ncbi:RNA-binding protein 44 isoform X10 [Danio rerio]|uniref:RNA-binding protein 44 isoform X10 n=3 Tax=Danio rerio TaxID=7955 RepID=A0AC58GER5_DANRE
MFQKMWYPPAAVVPFFESHSVTYEDRSAIAKWHFLPFDQRAVNEMTGFHNETLYTDVRRRCMLMRSLFELVFANNYLELTNPKLLGWFLYLTAEDRTLIQNEGGLLSFLKKHPELGVTRQYVYVKAKPKGNYVPPPTTMASNDSRYPTFYGSSGCQNCGTSCPFGTKKCTRCGVHIVISQDKISVSENEKQLQLLPNSLKEELNVFQTSQSNVEMQNIHLGCTQSTLNTRSKQRSPEAHPHFYSKGMCSHAQCLSQLWQEVESREDAKHFKDTSAQASFCLDMELDVQSQVQRNDNTQNNQNQSYNPTEENDHNVDQETMPEYYSFSSISLDHTAWSNGSQSAETGFNDSITATKGSTELSDELSEAANSTAANSTDCFSCVSNSFELAEESGDCLDSRYEQQINKSNVGSSPKSKSSASVYVDQMIDACGDFRAFFTSTCATKTDQTFQVKNVATDTDLPAVSHEKDTQTMRMTTSDKNTITEVYMSDLDVLTEEFIKLKETEKGLKQMKSMNARRLCGCDCAQRVRKAELNLLALQFVMCQQHCWRRYFTSPLGESAYQGTEALPDSIAETLKTLQKDYHEMRQQILAGTPLDDLAPLSVNSEKISTGTNYSPSSVSFQVLAAHLDCAGSTIASDHKVDEEHTAMKVPPSEVCQDIETAPDEAKNECSKRDKALFILPKQTRISTEPKTGANKDLNGSEAWFDAEEELGFPNQDGNMEKPNKMRETMRHKMETKGTDEDVSKQSSLLCITCLPGNITEHEVLLWFEKYNPTNVCISAFSNNTRAAIVYLKSYIDAKAAVEDLNGRSLQGHAVQVVHLSGTVSADLKPSDLSHSASESHKEDTAGDELRTKNLTYGSSHGGPRCSLERLTNVCNSPTASGTCVPQHYATMGSFDTIMARLSERHPNVARQRIVDALLELRAKHQGFLSGLPLRSIVDMTSELLTQTSSSARV